MLWLNPGLRGASHQPVFMGSCLNGSHTCLSSHMFASFAFLVAFLFKINDVRQKIQKLINFNSTFRSSRPEVFCKSLFWIMSQSWQESTCARVSPRPATLYKKIPWRRCFPRNLAIFLRTSFLKEHIRWLLPNFTLSKKSKYWRNCIFDWVKHGRYKSSIEKSS